MIAIANAKPVHSERVASRILGMGDVLSLIEQAEALTSKPPLILLERKGFILRQLGRKTEALAAYQQNTDLLPEDAQAWLEQALAQDSRNIATLHQLGVACERLGQRAEALRWWRRWVRRQVPASG